MPTNIVDVDAWTTPLVVPADGDLVAGAGMVTLGQGAGNRTEYLASRVFGAEAGEGMAIPLSPMPQSTASLWVAGVHTTGTGGRGLVQLTIAAAHLCYIELPQPKKATLTELTLVLAGATGHAGDPPATTMPRMRLLRQDPGSTAAPTEVGTITDTTATSAAYQVPHPIALTGMTEALTHDGYNRYYIEIRGETGGNAVLGLTVLDLFMLIEPAA